MTDKIKETQQLCNVLFDNLQDGTSTRDALIKGGYTDDRVEEVMTYLHLISETLKPRPVVTMTTKEKGEWTEPHIHSVSIENKKVHVKYFGNSLIDTRINKVLDENPTPNKYTIASFRSLPEHMSVE